MSESNIEMGARIQKLRILKGYTASKLAKLMGVTPAIVNKYEKGKASFERGKNLYNLSKILSTSPEYIIEGKGFSNINEDLGNKIPILNSTEIIEWCISKVKDISAYNKIIINNPLVNFAEKDIFAYKIESDSMQGNNGAGLPKGSIIICKPSSELKQQYTILYNRRNNDIIIREIVIDGKTYLRAANQQFRMYEMDEDISPIAKILCYVMIL